MAFNLGISGLLKFKKTLKLIEEGNYKLAAKEMLKSKWANQVKNRAKHLSIMMEKDCSFEEAKELI
jgi:lysozyme